MLSVISRRAVAAPNNGGPATPAGPTATPVLLELFTSEGCSSCPSADAVAAKLARTQSVQGARVIVLAHHIDYWNSLGWPDPFSSTMATSRQRSYAPLGGGHYTPQAVIDGRAEMVGSRAGAVEDALLASSKRAHAKVDLEVTAEADRTTFGVTAKVGALPEGSAHDAELLVSVVQDRARVVVPRGENSGRTLDHVGIARTLTTIGPVATSGSSQQTVVKLPAVISPPDGSSFSVVVFVQEKSSRRILGTSTAPLPSSR
jgi:hypothetical protein